MLAMLAFLCGAAASVVRKETDAAMMAETEAAMTSETEAAMTEETDAAMTGETDAAMTEETDAAMTEETNAGMMTDEGGADLYVLGKTGRNACPRGYSSITRTKDCRVASRALGLTYDAGRNTGRGECFCPTYCQRGTTTRRSRKHGDKAKWVCKADRSFARQPRRQPRRSHMPPPPGANEKCCCEQTFMQMGFGGHSYKKGTCSFRETAVYDCPTWGAMNGVMNGVLVEGDKKDCMTYDPRYRVSHFDHGYSSHSGYGDHYDTGYGHGFGDRGHSSHSGFGDDYDTGFGDRNYNRHSRHY